MASKKSKSKSMLVTVREYLDHDEAEIAKEFLESFDIDAILSFDDIEGMTPDMISSDGTVKLMVSPADTREAAKLLDEAEEEDFEDEDDE